MDQKGQWEKGKRMSTAEREYNRAIWRVQWSKADCREWKYISPIRCRYLLDEVLWLIYALELNTLFSRDSFVASVKYLNSHSRKTAFADSISQVSKARELRIRIGCGLCWYRYGMCVYNYIEPTVSWAIKRKQLKDGCPYFKKIWGTWVWYWRRKEVVYDWYFWQIAL